MTDPLLWLDGDTTDGRRARVHEPEAARTQPLPDLEPPPAPPRRGGRFSAALAGGLVAAVLVGGGGAVALGVTDDPPAAVPATPALVSPTETWPAPRTA